MREYLLYAMLIFFPIGFVMAYFLHREGLSKKHNVWFVSIALFIIIIFPISASRLGITATITAYIIILGLIMWSFLKTNQLYYLVETQAGDKPAGNNRVLLPTVAGEAVSEQPEGVAGDGASEETDINEAHVYPEISPSGEPLSETEASEVGEAILESVLSPTVEVAVPPQPVEVAAMTPEPEMSQSGDLLDEPEASGPDEASRESDTEQTGEITANLAVEAEEAADKPGITEDKLPDISSEEETGMNQYYDEIASAREPEDVKEAHHSDETDILLPQPDLVHELLAEPGVYDNQATQLVDLGLDLQQQVMPEQVEEVMAEVVPEIIITTPEIELSSGLETTDNAVDEQEQELTSLIDQGFQSKSQGKLLEAAQFFDTAWEITRDSELKYLLTMELLENYKESGRYKDAEQVLTSFISTGQVQPVIMEAMRSELNYLRVLAYELIRIGSPDLPMPEVPRWVRIKVSEEMKLQDK